MLKSIQESINALHLTNRNIERQLSSLASQEYRHFYQLNSILSRLTNEFKRTNDCCNLIVESIHRQNRRDSADKISHYFKTVNDTLFKIHRLNGHLAAYKQLSASTPPHELTEMVVDLDLIMQEKISSEHYNASALQQSADMIYAYLADEPEKAVGALSTNIRGLLNKKFDQLPNAVLLEEIMHALGRIVVKGKPVGPAKVGMITALQKAMSYSQAILDLRESICDPNYIFQLVKKINNNHDRSKKIVDQTFKEVNDSWIKSTQAERDKYNSESSDKLRDFNHYYNSLPPSSTKYTYSLMLTSRQGHTDIDHQLLTKKDFLIKYGFVPLMYVSLLPVFALGMIMPGERENCRKNDYRKHYQYSYWEDLCSSFRLASSDLYYASNKGKYSYVYSRNMDGSISKEYTIIAKLSLPSNGAQQQGYFDITFFKPNDKSITCASSELDAVQHPFDKASKFEDRKAVPTAAEEIKLIDNYNVAVRNMFSEYINLLQHSKPEKNSHFKFDLQKDSVIYSLNQSELPPLVLPFEFIDNFSNLPLIKKLEEMEQNLYGHKRIVYEFKNNELKLIYQFVYNDSKIIDCASIPVAKFDQRTVNGLSTAF